MRVFFLVLSVVLAAAPACAQNAVSFQARITGPGGAHIPDGTINMTFRVHNRPEGTFTANNHFHTFSNNIITLNFFPVVPNSEIVSTSDGGAVYQRDVAYTINYQTGRITRTANSSIPANGTVRVSYQYTSAVLWQWTQAVPVVGGLARTAIQGWALNVDRWDEPRFLEVQVADDSPMVPRALLSAVPRALSLPLMRTDDYRRNVIGGISLNSVAGSEYSVIAGGGFDGIDEQGTPGAAHPNRILGGRFNTISGGRGHQISGIYSGTIGGGHHNSVEGNWGTVPGGVENHAGPRAFAAGTSAKATHSGSFVWGDASTGDVASQRPNQFRARTGGGARFDINDNHWVELYSFTPILGGGARILGTSTGAFLSTGGNWTNSSDAALKENFQPVQPQEVLKSVVALPVSTWNYKAEGSETRHIGPTAQDFLKAFNLGADEKSISTVDASGVALAAIQGLYAELQERDVIIASLLERLSALERREQ